jgi:hypothetical protein
MSSPQREARHPVTETVAGARAGLRTVADQPVWSMSAEETAEALVAVTRLLAQAAQLQMRLLAHAEEVGVGAATGTTSPAAWLAHATNTTRAAAHRAARLGRGLDGDHAEVDAALAAGNVTADQASVIVHAVDELPTDLVDADTVARARRFLLDAADHHDATSLRVLGRRLLEVVDPDAADTEEARRLEREEADARAAASLTLTDDGHGQAHGRFTVPSLHGAILRKHLLALGAPGRNPDIPAQTPTRHRLGRAFTEYIETRPEDTVPTSGGLAATVVVTMDLDTLTDGLRAAGLCDGSRISAGEARRLACRAGIIPAVLGGASVPLDLGRRRRLHTTPMRIALGLRDRGCTATGCDRPPAWCHAHHDHPWSEGGRTNLDSGRLLCPRHHTLAHDHRYEMKTHTHGKVSFTRRT